MKSGKQRKAEIQAQRTARASQSAARAAAVPKPTALGTAPCNPELLAPFNSYGVPDFVARGCYADQSFTCKDCASEEVWRATQQKWWYEVAKGSVFASAMRCNACRRKERERVEQARRVQQQGMGPKDKETR
ncbi:zinc-ribbon domain-containing protein [Comamonas sp. Y33R10-2]|uniref:zinc-ribbon domain containing protein n=1 Tax=Comamonas sp. Y33R10-2 TaxID=2853257 RepID=UPI001C5C911C|nr:zinc-ribbon domain containing protein [Comamonas sp. Y33R10-2]QXZ09208.1 zinc-ribbon domain-containing protein [Comamonas sp. Y33R10-2]